MKKVIKISVFVMILTMSINTGSNASAIIPIFPAKTKALKQKVKRTKETNFYARRFGRFHHDKYLR